MNIRTLHHRMPELGVPLLRASKRIYSEVSLDPLYSQNRFRFTSAFAAHRFLRALPKEHAAAIHDVEIDLRNMSDYRPSVEREWVQYLCWAQDFGGIWARKMGGLRIDAPNIKTLRLNIEGWKLGESVRSVTVLQDLLRGPEKLDKVVVTGADGSELLLGAKDKYLEQWGPVVFVGIMVFAKLAGMIDWMAACVNGDRERMVVRWSKKEHVVNLEVMTLETFMKEIGQPSYPEVLTPASQTSDEGWCSLVEYEQRWHSRQWPGATNL